VIVVQQLLLTSMFSHHLVGLRPCNYHIIDAAWNEISLTINSVCLNEEGRRRKGAILWCMWELPSKRQN